MEYANTDIQLGLIIGVNMGGTNICSKLAITIFRNIPLRINPNAFSMISLVTRSGISNFCKKDVAFSIGPDSNFGKYAKYN